MAVALPPRKRLRTKTRPTPQQARVWSCAEADISRLPRAPRKLCAGVPGRQQKRGTTSTKDSRFGCREVGERKQFGRFEAREVSNDYLIVRDGLDECMLQQLVRLLNRKRPQAAKMKNEGAGESDDERKARYEDRDCLTSWFTPSSECPFLQDRVALLVQEVANVHWPLLTLKPSGEANCEYEQAQYTVYRQNQHFQAWHQDAYEEGHDVEDARQFALVIMLSDRKDYTGGQLQGKVKDVKTGRKVVRRILLDKGEVAIFPAKKLLHRVSAVKTGVRKTVVCWAMDRLSCHAGREAAKKGLTSK